MSFIELTNKAAELEVKLEELDKMIFEQDQIQDSNLASIVETFKGMIEEIGKVRETQRYRSQIIRSHIAALRGKESAP